MKIVSETKFVKALDLRGNTIFVKTIFEKNSRGQVFSRRVAVRQKVT